MIFFLNNLYIFIFLWLIIEEIKVWGGRLCHFLNHIIWKNHPMMVIHLEYWSKCVCWTSVFTIFKLLNLPPQTLISWSCPCPLSWVCQLACLKGFFCISAFTNVIMHSYLTIPIIISYHVSSVEYLTQKFQRSPLD
jgi:hypothetical protein